jgi:RNA ligase (TIGR02306 family)
VELQEKYKATRKAYNKARAKEQDSELLEQELEEIVSNNTIPWFEFLRRSKFRIKTKKLMGIYSQGICFPMSILDNYNTSDIKLEEGEDLTELLGVVKFEEEPPNCLEAKGHFPSHTPKTSEQRIQNMSSIIEKYPDEVFIMTSKLNGTSFTSYHNDGEVGVCSRNLEIKIDEDTSNKYKDCFVKYDLEDKLKEYGRNISIQGELIGEGIQKNLYKIRGKELHLFRIFDINSGYFLSYEEFTKVASELGLKKVPVLGETTLRGHTVDSLVKLAMRQSPLNENTVMEGIVFVSKGKIEGNRVSFKVINPESLV